MTAAVDTAAGAGPCPDLDTGALGSAKIRLEQATALLSQAQAILDRFNYKHKNQHRLTKWWASFDMLRRHTRKLTVGELQPALREIELELELLSQQQRRGKKRPRRPPTKPAAIAAQWLQKNAALVSLEAKARWMNTCLVPRTYLAFSHLAADNQFAHLGLLLLGVLAQVHEAATLMVLEFADQDGRKEGRPATESANLAMAPEGRQLTPLPPLEGTSARGDDELGVAVARDDEPAPAARLDSEIDTEQPRHDQHSFAGPITPSLLEMPGVKDTGKAKEKEKVKDRKKKKRKKGDEFDQLFSSLL